MATKQVIKEIHHNGDERNWTITISNLTNVVCYNARFQFTIPEGVALVGPAVEGTTTIEVPKGSYSPATQSWIIGNLDANEVVTANFIVRVEDIDLVENHVFILFGELVSSCNESDDCDNSTELVLKHEPHCDDPCHEHPCDDDHHHHHHYHKRGVSIG